MLKADHSLGTHSQEAAAYSGLSGCWGGTGKEIPGSWRVVSAVGTKISAIEKDTHTHTSGVVKSSSKVMVKKEVKCLPSLWDRGRPSKRRGVGREVKG